VRRKRDPRFQAKTEMLKHLRLLPHVGILGKIHDEAVRICANAQLVQDVQVVQNDWFVRFAANNL
jgi:hypothetical protein